MSKNLKKFFSNNKSIVITFGIILVLVLVLVLRTSFAAENNAERTLYRNQYFVSDNELSEPVLSESNVGDEAKINFVHESEVGDAKFIGFAIEQNGSVKYAQLDDGTAETAVKQAAKGSETELYSMYKSTKEKVVFMNLDEDTGKPIEGSEFKLIGQNYTATSVSDKSGRVEFTDVPRGEYKLINTNTSGDYKILKKEIIVEVGN